MSDKTEKQDKPKKGKGLAMKLVLGLVLIGSGVGGAYGLMTAGIIGHAAEAKETGPQLVRKGDEDPYAPPPEKGKEGAEPVYGDGGSEYRTAYFSFAEDFTSNLKDSDALVQMSLAASTRRDGRVLMWMNEHQLAIRSRMLVEIADTTEGEVISPEGKKDLQDRLTGAINAVLTEQEGFGGVDDVYFKSFIVQ